MKRLLLSLAAALMLSVAPLVSDAQNLNNPGQSNLNVPGMPYSQGSWTPAFTFATVNPTITYSEQVGTYEQTGRQVTVRFNMGFTTATTSPSGSLTLTGLPPTLPQASATGDNGVCVFSNIRGLTFQSGFTWAAGFISPSGVTILPNMLGSAKIPQNILGQDMFTPINLQGMCVYHVNP